MLLLLGEKDDYDQIVPNDRWKVIHKNIKPG